MASRTIITREPKASFRPFSRDALRLALVIGVLPNILFLLVMPFYIAERMLAPLLYLMAGLVSLRLPRWAAYPLFLMAALIDLGLIIMTAFHLPLGTALHSIRYMASLDIGASAFYLLVIAVVMATALLAAGLVNRQREMLRAASPSLATLIAGLFVLIDWQVNFPYIEGKVDGLPFESALSKSGFNAPAIAGRGNNLLIVMVEGMGAFAEPADRAQLADPLKKVTETSPFSFESGTSRYFGSTTGAESRELCGRWGDYQDYLGKRKHDCLPRRLAARGYETISYHGFSATMFSRGQWYPNIGFNRMHFAADIERDRGNMVPSRCGSVFSGLCDKELGSVVKREMLTPSDKPKMVYWLTLNSHVPFVPKKNGQFACTGSQPRIDNRTVCQLGEYWADVMDEVASIASDPNLPPTDILVVGDHHTPLWERTAKDKFALNKVDWFLLRHKAQRGSAARPGFGEADPAGETPASTRSVD
ncbi:MAG: sulfatase-like hydrolase/transferase [Sphingosinicella sp.]|nr:sulfatase-like hydrolase/transferase [Sphingosinicella sp.]